MSTDKISSAIWPGDNGGLPYARCGKHEGVHDAHYFPVRIGLEDHCPGWTAEEQTARDLIIRVNRYMLEHYRTDPEPENLRLEMHPSVYRAVSRAAALWGSATIPLEVHKPVKLSTDLPLGTWRLVIVTEEVLLEGKAADDPG